MFQHCLVLYLAALVLARPETYKEKEEFNYSRSSTDEGSKSGFYAAQRGNVGGNFEKAHNMDRLAQGQMSDIVSQVGAQAPDIANSKQGDLYGSAYAKGIYGQRRFDTGNLAGRNFQENAYTDSSNSQLASRYADSSSTHESIGTSTGSEASRFQNGYGTRAGINSGSSRNFGISQTADTGSYGTGSAYESTHASGYQAASQHRSSAYDQNHPTSDVISPYRVVPVRIAVRPLQPVSLGVQAGRFDQSVDSTFVHNEQENRAHSANSLAQNTDQLHTNGVKTGGLDNAKRYESSYNYRKEWEKHSEVTPNTLAIPTAVGELVGSDNQAYIQNHHRQSQNRNSASNIETFNTHTAAQNHQDGFKAEGYGYQRVAEPITNRYVVLSPTPEFVITGSKQDSHSSSHLSGYNAGSRSESQSAYRDQSLAQGHLSTNSDNLLASSSRNRDAALTVDTNSGGGVRTGPKKYESSYSYHKSWEKQGDPYIIQPASGPVIAQSENLKAYTNHGYGTKSTRYSAHSSQAEQEECDEHQRYTRSSVYGPRMHIHAGTDMKPEEDFEKQAEVFDQQTEDVGQHTEEFGQENQDLGQQSEDLDQQMEEFGQQSEDFGQQTERFVPTSNKQLANGQQNQRGWQYIEANHPVPPKGYQPSGSQMEDFVGQQTQEQAGIKYEDNFRQQVQTEWEQSQVGLPSQDTYARKKDQRQPNIYRNENIPVFSSDSTTLSIHNGIKNGVYPSAMAATQGQNYWGMHEQMTQHTFLQTEQQNGWQQEYVQKPKHNDYTIDQGINSYGRRDEEYEAQNSDIQYAMPTFLNPTIEESRVNNQKTAKQGYGYHSRSNSPVTTSAKAQRNENITPIVQDKEIDEDDAPVRGDLGTEHTQPKDTVFPTSTMKYISAANYEKYLQDIMETIRIQTATQNASDVAPNYSTYFSMPKHKTPEQIESLSSVLEHTPTNNSKITPTTGNIDRETNTHIANIEQKADTVPQSEYESIGQKIESFNTKFDQQELDSFFDQQPEIIAQEMENNREITDKHHDFEGPGVNYNPATNKIEYQFELTHRPKYLPDRLANTDLKKVSAEPSEVNSMVSFSKEILQTTTITTIKQAHDEIENQYVDTQESQKQVKQSENDEIGSETLNIEQQSTDFGQQSESFANWDKLGQFPLEEQPEDFGLITQADQNRDQHPLQEVKSIEDPSMKGKSFDDAPETDPESMAIYISEINQKPANPKDQTPEVEESKDFTRNSTDDDPSDKSKKPGFWKNVGMKITNAKDTVSCWFSKC